MDGGSIARKSNMKKVAISNFILLFVATSVVFALESDGKNEGMKTHKKNRRPNILFIFTDDQRSDGYGASGNALLNTPNIDRLAGRGIRFKNAFVTMSLCSPSRASTLTGRYGSANGVTSVGNVGLNPGEPTFSKALREAGYRTGVTGKWHLKTTPEECGFDFASICRGVGSWHDREFAINGKKRKVPGFVDDVVAEESIRFIRESRKGDKPFLLWMCLQLPHMDQKMQWPVEQRFLDKYDPARMPLPETWNDDLSGKPEYLKTSRNRAQAEVYGYKDPENIREHVRRYYASIEQMDESIGRVLKELDKEDLWHDTWILFMGDNGWLIGEHGMTSKVVAYEDSIRIPMIVAGPDLREGEADELVINTDLCATIYELAGLEAPACTHGSSLLPILYRKKVPWRNCILYEVVRTQHGTRPQWALRDHRWKYIETNLQKEEGRFFYELYDLKNDPLEKSNLADLHEYRNTTEEISRRLRQLRHDVLEKSEQP